MKSPGMPWVHIRPVATLVCACVAITALVAFPGVGLAEEAGAETWGPGWLKKMFVDEDEAPWAIGHMAKMKAKGLITGYPGGFFKPNSPVSRAELIATAVRLVGEEDHAKSKSGATLPFSDASYIQTYYPWAVGYLAEAMSHGLLSSTSDPFRPYFPATRAWAAEVFVRAIKLSSDAQAKMGSQLPFTDRYSVPSDKVGYVFIANAKGIMKGSGDMFMPNRSLTRAELATVLARCDDYLGPSASSELRGTISSVDADDLEITVKTYDSGWWSRSRRDNEAASFSGKVTLTVMPGALVLLDREHASLSALDSGCRVTVIKTGSYVSVIDAHSGQVVGWPGYEPEEDRDSGASRIVKGVVREIELGSEPTIRIRDEDGMSRIYDVSTECEVRLLGWSADLEDIKVGGFVTLRIVSDEVTRITAEEVEDSDNTVTGERKGTVTRLKTSSTPRRIYIDTGSGTARSYDVSSSVTVDYDEMPLEFEDIIEGDEVTLRLVGSTVRKITIEDRQSSSVSGDILAITSADGLYSLRMRNTDGASVTYPVHPDVSVRRGSDSLRMRDLRAGDTATLRLKGNVVTRVTVID